MKKIFLLLFLSLILTTIMASAVSAATALPTVGDGVCRTELGENRINSPQDCKPSAKDYANCYIDRDECIDQKTWNEVVLGLAIIIVLLVILIALKNNN